MRHREGYGAQRHLSVRKMSEPPGVHAMSVLQQTHLLYDLKRPSLITTLLWDASFPCAQGASRVKHTKGHSYTLPVSKRKRIN